MPNNTSTEFTEPLAVRPREAWRLLSCSNSYGYELLAAGELDSFADGNARKITVASIKSYIERRLAESGKVRKSPAKPFRDRKRKRKSSSTATLSETRSTTD
jgi:hypothetical protein